MPFDCQYKATFGQEFCLSRCPVAGPQAAFRFARVERPEDLPPAEPAVVDVALLDMHHGWPNLGHDALVHAMQNAVCDVHEPLLGAGIAFRVISYDVRRSQMLPEPPGGRHALYVGTGGPGHLDPTRNDGGEGSQGIRENPAWEPRLFAVFDAIRASNDAVLLGVCHTFGVMCRWLGAADAVIRGPEKGGKSAGIAENLLSDEARRHPWFSRFAEMLPDGERLRILDNRLYDLVPPRAGLPRGVTPIGWEALGVGGPRGDALTMIEVARDAGGVMPRIFAVNHHPEIVNRPRQITVLKKKLERGAVSPEWYAERMKTLTEPISDEWGDRLIHLTSSYTLMAPLRYHLYRLARQRAESLGRAIDVHEARMRLTYDPVHDTLPSTR